MDIEFYHPKADTGYDEHVYKVVLVLQLKKNLLKKVFLIVSSLLCMLHHFTWSKIADIKYIYKITEM